MWMLMIALHTHARTLLHAVCGRFGGIHVLDCFRFVCAMPKWIFQVALHMGECVSVLTFGKHQAFWRLNIMTPLEIPGFPRYVQACQICACIAVIYTLKTYYNSTHIWTIRTLLTIAETFKRECELNPLYYSNVNLFVGITKFQIGVVDALSWIIYFCPIFLLYSIM